MDWLTILEDYCAAVYEEKLELRFQARVAGAKLR
jgi:hypothetical protein|tara:strand:- start:296 stop:397 length:102 start_codon:yes stop_codon:yes gene_type:complete